jgi:hypothetical protein
MDLIVILAIEVEEKADGTLPTSASNVAAIVQDLLGRATRDEPWLCWQTGIVRAPLVSVPRR